MRKNNVFNMTATAMFTAMIFIFTRFISIPIGNGYVHLGDSLVYVVACTVSGPWAMFAAVAGEALADLSYGMVYYAPATIIVKALVALIFIFASKKSEKILTPLTAIMSVVSGVICVLGYFVADMIINKAYALTNVVGNVIQSACSVLAFMIISGALDSAGLKKKLFIERK